ncbi:MAG: FAD:protein FMN transferase [Acidimicrobiales bacterium]
MVVAPTLVMETRTAVMGTRAEVLVRGGPPGLAARAVGRLHELHARWSRFDSHSEVSALNRRPHSAIEVSADTVLLVHRAVQAWILTDGAFDPTVLGALVALGYDRSFDEGLDSCSRPAEPQPSPGCAGIEIDHERSTVRLGSAVGFDPGGIGKGLAADLVTNEVMAAGASGVMVNLGGDLRVRGPGPQGQAWPIAVREPMIADEELATVHLLDAALATSTPCRRGWATAGGRNHHLVDPASGRSHENPPVLVSAVAGEAWWAEAVTKAALSTDPDGLPECAVFRRHRDGTTERFGAWDEYDHG